MSIASELIQFRDFLNEQLELPNASLSPEEALDLWRLENPEPEQFAESIASLKLALEEVDSGGKGRDAKLVSEDLRRALNLPNAT